MPIPHVPHVPHVVEVLRAVQRRRHAGVAEGSRSERETCPGVPKSSHDSGPLPRIGITYTDPRKRAVTRDLNVSLLVLSPGDARIEASPVARIQRYDMADFPASEDERWSDQRRPTSSG
jgi:hypothetical protein